MRRRVNFISNLNSRWFQQEEDEMTWLSYSRIRDSLVIDEGGVECCQWAHMAPIRSLLLSSLNTTSFFLTSVALLLFSSNGRSICLVLSPCPFRHWATQQHFPMASWQFINHNRHLFSTGKKHSVLDISLLMHRRKTEHGGKDVYICTCLFIITLLLKLKKGHTHIASSFPFSTSLLSLSSDFYCASHNSDCRITVYVLLFVCCRRRGPDDWWTWAIGQCVTGSEAETLVWFCSVSKL